MGPEDRAPPKGDDVTGNRGATTYTVSEAAELLGISRRTIDKWVSDNVSEDGQRSYLDVAGGRVTVLRVSSRWRIVARELDPLLRLGAEPVAQVPPRPADPSRCDECSAGQHHGCVVWGSACGCARSVDEVWADVEAWARRTGRLR